MSRKKLEISRKRIDLIDRKIFHLVKMRTNVVKYMLSLKKNKKEIVDRKRIREILKKIRKKSIKNRVDPKITHKIWKTMIYAYVDFQKRNFKKK